MTDSVKSSSLRKTARFAWIGLLVVIIIAGVTVSLGRLASPYLSHFKGDIEDQVGQLLGTRIQIGNIDASWQGFGPKLVMHDIQISHVDAKSAPLSLRRVDLDLATGSLFREGEFLSWNITIYGLRLQLIRETDGQFDVVGLNNTSDQTDRVVNIDPLFSMRRLELVDTVLQWTDLTGRTPFSRFEDIRLLMRNQTDRHQIDLSFDLAPDQQQSIRIAADFHGSVDQLASVSGGLFLETRGVDPSRWLTDILPDTVRLHQALLDTRLWLNFREGRLLDAHGDASLSDVKLTRPNGPNAADLIIEQLSGNFTWRNHSNSNTEFLLNGLDIRFPEQAGESMQLAYLRKPGQVAYLSLSRLDLSLLERLGLLLPENWIDLETLPSAAGRLTNIQASWQPDFQHWSVLADLQGISLKTGKSTPGIANLDARLKATATGGQLQLDAQQLEFEHPSLFRKPIPLKRLHGTLTWQRHNGSIHVNTNALTAVSPHLSTISRASILLGSDDSITMDLQTDFHEGEGSATSLYLPYSIMDEELVAWLDRAIVSGRVTSGSFVFKGPVKDFAFSSTHNGHFEVLFNVEDMILDYLEGWPRIEEIDAQVRFHNNSLDIDLFSGKFLNSEITRAHAHIASLDPTSPIQLSGRARGPVQDSMHLLTETPLQENFSSLAESLAFTGSNETELKIQVPLEDGDAYQLDGKVIFNNNSLYLQDWNLAFEKISGELHFDLEGIHTDNLQASLLGSALPVKIDNDSNDRTLFNARVSLSESQLAKIFSQFPVSLVQGKTTLDVALSIPPISQHDAPASLLIESDLEGMSVLAPSPFGKSAAEKTPLRISARLHPGNDLPLRLHYRKNITAGVLLLTPADGPYSLKSGYLHFGEPAEPVMQPGVFSISGKTAELDLHAWLQSPLLIQPGEGNTPDLIVDLHSQHLVYQDTRFDNFHLQAEQAEQQFNGKFSSDQFDGQFSYSSIPPGKLDIQLNRAALTMQAESGNSAASSSSSADKLSLKPAQVPAIDLQIQKLLINEHDFGQLSVKTLPIEQNMKLESIKLNGELLQLDGTGLWTGHEQDQRSHFNLTIQSSNIGEVLTQLGFIPQLEQGSGEARAKLNWQGNPMDFALERLTGELSLDMKKGRFLDIEPGVGRILGILNIAALYRRLTLDFSDLFREGFSYDSLTADFRLERGDAFTDNLVIKGPPATIELSGRTGLHKEDYQQMVTVTPSLQSAITLAGAVAGGPAGAALAYIAQKIIGSQVDKIARTRYSITGQWDDPQIIELQIPDKISVDENPQSLDALQLK